MYELCETRIACEADNDPIVIVQSWIGSIQELRAGYKLNDLWSMDETGFFLKALPEKDTSRKLRVEKVIGSQNRG